jgi:hypothetical protein
MLGMVGDKGDGRLWERLFTAGNGFLWTFQCKFVECEVRKWIPLTIENAETYVAIPQMAVLLSIIPAIPNIPLISFSWASIGCGSAALGPP